MKKVNVGIIGCGKVAHLHAAALNRLPEANFTAVTDRIPERAQAFAERYRVKAYSDIQDMVSAAGIEAVIVCTPHPVHAESTIQAAQASIQVLIEKPMASSLADCDAMLNAANDAGVESGHDISTPAVRAGSEGEAGHRCRKDRPTYTGNGHYARLA